MVTLEQKIDIILEWIAGDMSNNPIIRRKAQEVLDKSSAESSISDTVNIDYIITGLFKELNISSSLVGYNYLSTAIKLVLDDPMRINTINKRIYAEIADEYNTTNPRIERAIRTISDRMVDNTDYSIVRETLGNIVSAKTGNIPNGTFIAACVQEVKRRMKLYGIE